jgi:pescadillo
MMIKILIFYFQCAYFLKYIPISFDFREIKVHRRKVKKAVAKKTGISQTDSWIVHQLTSLIGLSLKDIRWTKHDYSWVHWVLSLFSINCSFLYRTGIQHLFETLPAVDGERVEVKRIHNCRRYALFNITLSFSRLDSCSFQVH